MEMPPVKFERAKPLARKDGDFSEIRDRPHGGDRLTEVGVNSGFQASIADFPEEPAPSTRRDSSRRGEPTSSELATMAGRSQGHRRLKKLVQQGDLTQFAGCGEHYSQLAAGQGGVQLVRAGVFDHGSNRHLCQWHGDG
jgi:hypothetical protein